MKEYLKTLGKFLFWNFLSAAILGSLIYFMGLLDRAEEARRKAQGIVGHRSVFSELEQTFTRECSLVDIFWSILILGILLGIVIFAFWCCFRTTKIYKKPDTKQRKLLVSSDVIVGACSWIVVVCYWGQYVPTLPWFLGFLLIMAIISQFLGKALLSSDR